MKTPAHLSQPSAQQAPDPQNLVALVALQHIEHLGTKGLSHLLDSAESPLDVIEGRLQGEQLEGLNSRARKSLASFLRSPHTSVQWEIAQRTLQWLHETGAQLLVRGGRQFPSLLAELPDSPAFLYARGDVSLFEKPAISIVGTRKPTPVGYRFARQLACELGDAGFVVVSGMALGIDAAAHSGALQSPVGTVAVWATGLDVIYPASHNGLAHKICQQGLVITEMPLGTTSNAGYFPRRNRIVSGVSVGVIVVEAALPSGSLITAQYAAEQGREVFAVPGQVGSSVSRGCHQLLRDGATLVESVDDILMALQGVRTIELPGQSEPAATNAELPPELRQLVDILAGGAQTFEALALQSGMTVDALNMALIDLELTGSIVLESGRYNLKRA